MSNDQSSSSMPAPWEPSPPPYSEHETRVPTEHVPQYEAPHWNTSTGDSTRLQAATKKFPPALNGYFQWRNLTREFHLGPAGSEKLFSMSLQVEHRKSKQTMILRNGPTEQDPPLALMESDAYLRAKPVTITILPQTGSHESPIVEPFEGFVPYKRISPTFSIAVGGTGKDAHCEKFQWRSSHGKEIKELGGYSSGWKLVRLSHTVGETSASRSERTVGCSSDGREIVAVVAHNASWSLTKGFRFAFLGSGLTGILGEDWETMAVITAVHIWLVDFQVMTNMVPIT
ncbi:hypothetical protein BDV28DRAFT_132413 [Aspergillus coremiiformis]|uniref:Tubby C-terminal-like domain-containing protein n=1 Tax=Aspergillus coremiiformis TaxID=138285 RepID=A0A5N6ZA96_9EURO|nr:hypothetical protein BDV28DRAFT_132413 [Aspergillus coremiiformis]